MLNYSNKGMFLETLINISSKYYESNNICIISKREIPISIISNTNNTIIGKLKGKSTTDYYGVFKGRAIDFEAKQTQNNYFLLSNIKKHQWDHLILMKQMQAISFVIIYFITNDSYFAIDIELLNKMKGKTKIGIEWCEIEAYKLKIVFPGILDIESFLEYKISKI